MDDCLGRGRHLYLYLHKVANIVLEEVRRPAIPNQSRVELDDSIALLESKIELEMGQRRDEASILISPVRTEHSDGVLPEGLELAFRVDLGLYRAYLLEH
jgi:hypothetical protein